MSQKRNKGFLVPSVIDPPDRKCVKVFVPDDPIHIANFWGVLNFLTLWTEYERTGNDDGAQVANVWKQVYLDARATFENQDCGMDCDDCLERVRIRANSETGELELSTDGGITFVEMNSTTIVYPTASLYTDRAEQDTRCAVSANMSVWLMEKWGDVLDALETAADAASAFDILWAILPPLYITVDAIMDAMNEILEATVNACRAADTVEFREELKCWMFCNFDDYGEFSEEQWDDLKHWVADDSVSCCTPAASAMYIWLSSLEYKAIRSEARLWARSEGACGDCPCGYDWEEMFVFDSSDQLGWEKFGGRPMTFGADGIVAGVYRTVNEVGFSDRRAITIYNNMIYRDGTTTITEMRTVYEGADKGNSNITGSDVSFGNQRIREEQGGLGTNVFDSGSLDIAEGDGQVQSRPTGGSGVINTDNSLIFYMQFAQSNDNEEPLTGYGAIPNIRIRGTGKNPFIP